VSKSDAFITVSSTPGAAIGWLQRWNRTQAEAGFFGRQPRRPFANTSPRQSAGSRFERFSFHPQDFWTQDFMIRQRRQKLRACSTGCRS
jgi:hypothetical protein